MPCPSRDDAGNDELRRLRDVCDHAAHSALARVTVGLSPAALAEAYADWAVHLAVSPGKQMEVVVKAARKWARLARFAPGCGMGGGQCDPCIEPLPQDRRFVGAEWRQWPYNLVFQSFLLQQQWWHNATTGIDGVTKQHENVVEFTMRQVLDMVSPSNFLATNPVVQNSTRESSGQNLADGFKNLLADWEWVVRGQPPVGAEAFQVDGTWRHLARRSSATNLPS